MTQLPDPNPLKADVPLEVKQPSRVLGRFLGALLKDAGLSQAALARAVGDRSTRPLSELLAGKSAAIEDTVERYLVGLGRSDMVAAYARAALLVTIADLGAPRALAVILGMVSEVFLSPRVSLNGECLLTNAGLASDDLATIVAAISDITETLHSAAITPAAQSSRTLTKTKIHTFTGFCVVSPDGFVSSSGHTDRDEARGVAIEKHGRAGLWRILAAEDLPADVVKNGAKP